MTGSADLPPLERAARRTRALTLSAPPRQKGTTPSDSRCRMHLRKTDLRGQRRAPAIARGFTAAQKTAVCRDWVMELRGLSTHVTPNLRNQILSSPVIRTR